MYATYTPTVIFAGYPDLTEDEDWQSILIDETTVELIWNVGTPPKPTVAQVDDWYNDAVTLPTGQLYSEWAAINGGDPDATARDQARRLYDEISTPGAGLSSVSRLDRATMRAIVDEFNRHSDTDYAGIHVQAGSSNSQPIVADTETRVTLWTGTGEVFKDALADDAAGTLTTGKAGHYRLSLACSYTHTGGGTCDMTWRIKADGQTADGFSTVNQTDNAIPDVVSIGPYVTGHLEAGTPLEVTVQHEETTDKNLIIAYAQFYIERLPSINERTFDQLRAVLLAKLEEE